MNYRRALAAGALGGIVSSLLMEFARREGVRFNLEMILGTMAGFGVSSGTWILGLLLHLSVAACIALLYAMAFESAGKATALLGAAFGLFHFLIAGLLLGFLPAIDPLIPEAMPAPGTFLSAIPIGPYLFLLLHLVYGAIVGAIYKPLSGPRHILSHA